MSLSQERQAKGKESKKSVKIRFFDSLFIDILGKRNISIIILLISLIIKVGYDIIKPGIPAIREQSSAENWLILVGGILLIFLIFIIRYLDGNKNKFLDEYQKNIEKIYKKAYENLENIEGDTDTKSVSIVERTEENTKSDDNSKSSFAKESNIPESWLIEFFKATNNLDLENIVNKNSEPLTYIKKQIINSVDRLKKEIEQITRRANLNLAIGSTVTMAALISLSYFIVHENFNSIDIKSALLRFIPRLSLVIFIEFFSFFFLRLYRANLNEIKYYQNELTNIEIKSVAIDLAVKHGDKFDISALVKDISLVERNFKLQKGESTVELERNKAETHDLKEILKAALGTYKKEK